MEGQREEAGAERETRMAPLPWESLEPSGQKGKAYGESEDVLSSMTISYKRNNSKS